MQLTITNKEGVTLHTAKKYCKEDIAVQVKTEELNITPSTEEQVNEGLFTKVTVTGVQNGDIILPIALSNMNGSVEIYKNGENIFNYDYCKNYNNTIMSAYRFVEITNLEPNTRYMFFNYDLENILKDTKFPTVYLARYPNYANGIAGAGAVMINKQGRTSVSFTTGDTGKGYLGAYISGTWTSDIWNTLIDYFKNAQLSKVVECSIETTDTVVIRSIEEEEGE